jgi:cytochrome c
VEQIAVSDEPPEFGVLKVAPGVETTYYACVACHSERIVAQQGLSRDHWDELFEWMVDEQGMSEIEEPDRTEILDYLAEHYNEDRPNFPIPGN